MKTFKGTCLQDTILSDDDKSFTLLRGTEYILSPTNEKGEVTVFSTQWLHGVPVSLFGGLILGPGESHDDVSPLETLLKSIKN